MLLHTRANCPLPVDMSRTDGVIVHSLVPFRARLEHAKSLRHQSLAGTMIDMHSRMPEARTGIKSAEAILAYVGWFCLEVSPA